MPENDPFVDYALKEACTYLCDVIAHLNLRYSPKVANDVIRLLKLRMSEDQERWEAYTTTTAPRVIAETKRMLGIECA